MNLVCRPLSRFVSIVGVAVATAGVGLSMGCATSVDDAALPEEELAEENPTVRAFCELEFSCHAEHYDSVEHCVEVTQLSDEASLECSAAYDDVLFCLTETNSCDSLRSYYLREPADNYPCRAEDEQGYLCR